MSAGNPTPEPPSDLSPDAYEGLTGDDKKNAGSAVAWQCVMATMNELVRQFNTVTFGSDASEFKHNREVQLKKLLLGMLYEVVDCLNNWTGVLRKAGMFDDDIKAKKQAFEDAYRKVGLAPRVRGGGSV